MAWTIVSTATYDEWVHGLTVEEQIEVLSKVALLQDFGPKLSRPHADTLAGSRFSNMKELRAKTATSQLRVAFAFDVKRQAVLLVGGAKQGKSQSRFYKQLIARADKLFAEHLR